MPTPQKHIQRDKLIIRPAQASDRGEVVAISAQIWDGDDYIPNVFDKWITTANNYFDVLTYDDKVIGVGKLTCFGAEEWWLEGLRIDPAYQGQGLARVIHHYKVNQARQVGTGVLRFSTSSENMAIHKLAIETGFSKVTEFYFARLPSADKPSDGLQMLSVEHLAQVQAWLANSTYFQQADRSFETTWKWQFVTPELLVTYLDTERVYGWYGMANSGQLQGIFVIDQLRTHADTTLYTAYAEAEDLTNFWASVQGLAHNLGGDHISLKIVNHAEYIQPLEAYGSEWQELNISLFSRPLTLTVHSDIEHPIMPALN